jgi:alkanesulfonate monooxygenase SsuD/methylene tetrahydromethanopterin reductase-like flavin-dependent oxidoreductase (luciferase family)
MNIGVTLPLGCDNEFAGWTGPAAWSRLVAVAQAAERLGFESAWAYDHVHTDPVPSLAPTLEPMVSIAAVAGQTSRIRLGHLVLSAGYRNPALVAKMMCSLDLAARGRIELGIGAGWKKDEWVAYGYGYPTARERLGRLADSLEIITRMLGPGTATYAGQYASVIDAFNEPKGVQLPRIPIVVGGNGPTVTWRIAARFADELNLDGMLPHQVRDALPVIAQRCEEVDRDPGSLRISVHLWGESAAGDVAARADRLSEYASLGVSRVIAMTFDAAHGDGPLESWAEAAIKSGLPIRATT